MVKGFDVGYDAGFQKGHDEGFEEGHNEGWQQGHDAGCEEMVEKARACFVAESDPATAQAIDNVIKAMCGIE